MFPPEPLISPVCPMVILLNEPVKPIMFPLELIVPEDVICPLDVILFADVDDSNNLKKTTAGDIVGLASAGVSLGLVIALT